MAEFSAVKDDRTGLIYQGALPLTIRKVLEVPGDYELARVNHSNEVLLKAGLILNDHQDLDEYHELTPFLQKQDLKLNLLINLISELVKTSQDFPESRSLQMTPECIILDPGSNVESLQTDDIVSMDIHLVAEMPKALSFYGIVKQVGKETGKQEAPVRDMECRIDFLSLDQQVSDQLEKILFRFHRRKIAQQKIAEQSSVQENNTSESEVA